MLAVISKSTEFCRCVYGTKDTVIRIVMAYVCDKCEFMPECDFDYTVVTKCGQLSGWFCSKCGGNYETRLMRGVLAIANSEEPSASVVLMIGMPQGKTANFLSFAKLVNNMRMGNMPFTVDDGKKACTMAAAIKKFIVSDNSVACTTLALLGATKETHTKCTPDLDRDTYPYFQIAEEPGDVTLTSNDFGTQAMYFI
jgi:hypothetical protein